MLKRLLINLARNSADANYGRDIIVDWCKKYHRGHMRVLDIGCGYCFDLLNVRRALDDNGMELYGVECDHEKVEYAGTQNIRSFPINVENERIPLSDGSLNVVIANQVIEHAKEIFWIFSEISRTLAPGGLLIIGIPNLASLHNRLYLLAGEQPTCIETMGPHVRGFTAPSLRRFIEAGEYFKVIDIKGSNFYPLPASVSKHISRLMPRLSVSLFMLAIRTDKKGTFINVLNDMEYETPFFRGELIKKH